MNEAYCVRKLVSALNTTGYFIKVPDPKGDFRTVKRPVDIVGCSEGRFYGLEVKWRRATTGESSVFSLKHNVRPEQWANLERIKREGGVALLVVALSFPRGVQYYPFKYSPEFTQLDSVVLFHKEGFFTVKETSMCGNTLESISLLADWRCL